MTIIASSVVEDYIEDHIKYESIRGRHKIEVRNRSPLKLKILQNGDKDGAGGQLKKTVAMIVTEQNHTSFSNPTPLVGTFQFDESFYYKH